MVAKRPRFYTRVRCTGGRGMCPPREAFDSMATSISRRGGPVALHMHIAGRMAHRDNDGPPYWDITIRHESRFANYTRLHPTHFSRFDRTYRWELRYPAKDRQRYVAAYTIPAEMSRTIYGRSDCSRIYCNRLHQRPIVIANLCLANILTLSTTSLLLLLIQRLIRYVS